MVKRRSAAEPSADRRLSPAAEVPGLAKDRGRQRPRWRTRVRAGIARIASRHPDQTVAVFSHGGVISRILAEATDSRVFAFLGVDNGSISHLVATPDWMTIRSYDDPAHLDESALPC